MSLLLNCKTIKPVDQPAPIAIDEPQGELVAISWSTSNISGGQVRVFRVITDALDIAVMSKQLNHEINPEKRNDIGCGYGTTQYRWLPSIN